AMHRLEAVADVRQRAADDHAHGVIEVAAPHFVFEVDRDDFLGEIGHRIACILVAPGEAGPSGTVARKRGGGAVRPRRGQGWNAITKRRSTPPDSAQNQALARPERRCPTFVGWHARRPPRPPPASGCSATASGSIPTAGAASAATGLRPRGRPFPPPSQGRAALPWHPPLAPSPGRGRRASPRRTDCSGAVRSGARSG